MVTTRNDRRPDRDRQLAQVAAALFRSRGYAAVSVNDIAAAAGVTGAALYRHYPGKQALLAHVLLDGLDHMERAASKFLAELEEAPAGAVRAEQVTALLGAIATASVDQRDITALWRTSSRHLSPDAEREIARRTSAILARWSAVLRRLRPDLSAPDAELLCWAALSVFGSTSVHRTTVPRTRYTQLLTAAARRVLHAPLPPAGPGLPGGPQAPGLAVSPQPRRELLITQAALLFQVRGFNAVTMEAIGEAAGIAGPSIYRYFPAKSALLAAIVRRAAERVAISADEAVRAGSDPADALRRLTASYACVLTGSPELSVAFSIERSHLAQADLAESRRVQRDYVARWSALLQSCHQVLTPAEAKVAVHAALTIANDLTRTRRISQRPNLPAELAALMTAALDLG